MIYHSGDFAWSHEKRRDLDSPIWGGGTWVCFIEDRSRMACCRWMDMNGKRRWNKRRSSPVRGMRPAAVQIMGV
jgi:hypothetical protein